MLVTPYAQRPFPRTPPNAQLSAFSVTSILVSRGTLTVTAAKPTLQQLPGNFALTRTFPVFASTMANSGDEPSGMNFEYSSPARP
jgi:hypothetical protein